MRTPMLLLMGAAVASMWACHGLAGPAATPTTLPDGPTTTTINTTDDFFDLAALHTSRVDQDFCGQATSGTHTMASRVANGPHADD